MSTMCTFSIGFLSELRFSVIHTDIMSEHDMDMITGQLQFEQMFYVHSLLLTFIFVLDCVLQQPWHEWQNDFTRCLMLLQNRRRGRLIYYFMIKLTYLRGSFCAQTQCLGQLGTSLYITTWHLFNISKTYSPSHTGREIYNNRNQ